MTRDAAADFADHFSRVAGAYARHRPRYPDALFAWLAAAAPARRRAWDCGTGSGQAAVALAAHFAAVVATDSSAGQLAAAVPHPRVAYVRAAAERSPLASEAFDVVTAAQALHWFDVPAFYREATRVLSPGGLLAVWSYNLAEIEPGLDEEIRHLYADVLGPYWPPERALVERGYRDLPFPVTELAAPELRMEQEWDLDALLGYLGTWSAADRYQCATGRDAVADARPRLLALWGEPRRRRLVRWPLRVRAGYR